MVSYIHTFISTLYLVIAVTTIIKFAIAWKRKYQFTKIDKYLALSLLSTLYIQMLMGIYLFYIKINSTIIIHNNSLEDRFWPLEHFFVMLFSILIAQLGYIYSQNLKKSEKKFKTLFLYFTSSFLLVMISLAMIFL